MAWVFDNTDAFRCAKKSRLKTLRAKLGLLNSALYTTYGLKLKGTNNKHIYYYLVGAFDSIYAYAYTPELPPYQTETPPNSISQNTQDLFDIVNVLNKYNLSAESNPLQLCAHADEISTMLPDWKAHKDVKEALCQRLFKENQIGALVSNNKKKRLTIKKRAQYCAKTKDVWDIWLHALDLAVPKNNTDKAIVAASSHVSQFCRELAEAEVGSEQIYIYAKLPEVTRASNEIQKRQLEQ
ncbi:13525_t:CDS:2 [Cetraspora pellucida]|uniref:13525_t:CDS:1 n=1 Tax=Cetraspora pellucida TaxID=1433469 RepID=A0A9N9ISS7_9GLOM|nr:13525_t:CDS:2 [Cetraspora pellucida]